MALRFDTQLNLTREMRQTLLRVGIGALLLALAAYILVAAPLWDAHKLDAEILEAKARLERSQKLMPAIASLATGGQNATVAELALPKPEPMPRTQVYLVTEQLTRMGTDAALEPLEVSLNPASMAQDPGSIQVQGLFSGQMQGVRSFLMALGRMPSLARMERVEIRAVDGHLEMLVQLRIALQK